MSLAMWLWSIPLDARKSCSRSDPDHAVRTTIDALLFSKNTSQRCDIFILHFRQNEFGFRGRIPSFPFILIFVCSDVPAAASFIESILKVKRNELFFSAVNFVFFYFGVNFSQNEGKMNPNSGPRGKDRVLNWKETSSSSVQKTFLNNRWFDS